MTAGDHTVSQVSAHNVVRNKGRSGGAWLRPELEGSLVFPQGARLGKVQI
jgi:hypothetical protein